MPAISNNNMTGAKAMLQQPACCSANSSGMVLVVVIIFAALACILAVGLHVASGSRLAQVKHALRFDKAFFVAEAGIEHAKSELRYRAEDLDEVLKGADATADTADDGVLSFGSPTNYGEGRFYVKVRNNDSEADPFVDTDHIVIVRSTGIVENVARVIEAEVLVSSLVPSRADGALGIYGTNTELTVSGHGNIDGHDWNVPGSFDCNGAGCNGSVSTNTPSAGVLYTSTTTVINADSDAIDGHPDRVNGVGAYNEIYWYQFLNDMMAVATIYTPGGPLGTRNAPIVSMLPSGTTTINGNVDGAGILIVPGYATLRITGTFHYEGLVILEGDGVVDADNEFSELGTARIFGAMICVGGALDILATGTADIKYSTDALENLSRLEIPAKINVRIWREIKASSAVW